MPTDLILAPVGSGKTERALEALMDAVQQQPFAQVWVLLPSRRQEDAFRQRLAERGNRIYFNVSFFNFYTLYARLLDMVGQPQRELDNTARLRLLRGILSDLREAGQLQIYDRIAETPGFVRLMADFIYELKQNVIYPNDFAAAARNEKDQEIALIYNEYQNILQQYQLVDREGEGWLALAQVRDEYAVATDVSLLLVDGFDQFNPLQAQLLALLSSRARKTLVTLPVVPGRESTVGRRFQQAQTRLYEFHERARQSAYPYTLSPASPRHTALNAFVQNAFLPGFQPVASDGALNLIEAPDTRQEVAAVLRRVKRLILDGCRPDDILVAVRDWERYGDQFAVMARLYDIPVALHYGEPLANNPAIIAFFNLLELAEHDFRRQDLLDTLRSPYFAVAGFDSAQVDLLERISLSQQVIGGREMWLDAILSASKVKPSDEDELEEKLLESEDAAMLHEYLTAFFDLVTPPPAASVTAYIGWLEDLIGSDVVNDPDEGDSFDDESQEEQLPSLNILRQIRRTDDAKQALVDRDLIALRALKKVLRSLFAAQNLFLSLDFDEPDQLTQWDEFRRDLHTATDAAALNRGTNRSGQVLITIVADARGLPHRHVFIPGLSEGVFPAPIPEDPLYLDSERRALAERGIYLETQAERAADEGLFYELVGLASDSLTLSRPTVQNGTLWPESYLWRITRDFFSDAQELIQRDRIALGAVIAPADVASQSEAALVVANGMNQAELTPDIQVLYQWLMRDHSSQWSHVHSARNMELRRMSRRGYDRYSGILSQPELVDWVAGQLDADHIWSASQFNDYGQCGFRFFSKRLLRLEKVKEPEEGMDAAQLGTLNHAILEKTYARLVAMRVTITPDFAEQAVAVLHEVADTVLRDAPHEIGFRASALWEQEKITLVRKLEALVRLDFSEGSPAGELVNKQPRQPYRQEAPFSPNERHMLEISIDDDAIGRLKVTGYIDRMDRSGDRVIVVDYKTGSTPINTEEMQRGRNFQMMLYLLAGNQILKQDTNSDAPSAVTGGFFWHLRTRKSTGMISLDNEEDQDAVQQARQHLVRHIQAGRQGVFMPEPNKLDHGACAHYCEFNEFCRVSVMRRSRRQG